jgi:2-oxoglutarate dehydrogenase E1 component
MTPKSLLRHPLAVSSLNDLASGEYSLVIPEIDDIKAKTVDRVILCCGKVYYDLLEKRRELKRNNIAIVRVEQLYPFPTEEVTAILKSYPQAKDVIWCQEEPQNQGAWDAIENDIEACMRADQTLRYVGRAAAASPAAGYTSVHVKQQEALVADALAQ